jgi:DMSO/TMAO reductase YedYZ molybdopterin-dependent catalytic subunit
MMNKKIPITILAFLLLVVGNACTKKNNDATSAATQSRYRENEIQEYKGAKLDPAIGPRDNSISGVQHVKIDSYRLKIDGLVKTPTILKYENVTGLLAYERKITLHCVEGWEATILWKGALIKDILDLAGVRPEATTVIFHSVDGYTTALPLKTILDRQLILAYGANGLALPNEMGFPFIVVAEDKLGYKWARWVSQIELSSDASYLGYWESRGYTNEADAGK